jgi:glycosidase
MNYPLRNAAIAFLTERDAERLYDTLTEIYSSYPPSVCNLLMNILGTHDTERIISRIASNIGACENIDMLSNSQKAKHTLSPDGYERAKKLLTLGSTLQFTVYGLPSVYYGDEAGLTGCSDPFCRKPFPWGREDGELLLHYKKLGELRKNEKILQNGDFTPYLITEHALGFKRELLGEHLLVLLSREKENIKLSLDGEYLDLLEKRVYNKEVTLESDSALVLKKK